MFAATRKIAQKYGAKVAAVPAGALVLVGSAQAALPEGVTEAINTYKTDALSAIGVMIAAGVAIWGLLALKRKLGW